MVRERIWKRVNRTQKGMCETKLAVICPNWSKWFEASMAYQMAEMGWSKKSLWHANLCSLCCPWSFHGCLTFMLPSVPAHMTLWRARLCSALKRFDGCKVAPWPLPPTWFLVAQRRLSGSKSYTGKSLGRINRTGFGIWSGCGQNTRVGRRKFF